MLAPCAAAAAPARLACRRQLPGSSARAWLPAAARRRATCRPTGRCRVLAAKPSAQEPVVPVDPDPQRFTNLNKPVMRLKQTIPYGQFLNDVRSLAVKEVVLTHEGTDRACVVYKDGNVRYVQFPADDSRVADVLETYGVTASQAVNEPQPLDTSETLRYKDLAMYWIPGVLITIIYLIVNGLARRKGDWEDRVKLRKLQEAERRELKKRSALEYEAALKAEREAANEAYLKAQEAAERGDQPPPEAVSEGMGTEEADAFMRVNVKRTYARKVDKGEEDEEAAAAAAVAKAEAPGASDADAAAALAAKAKLRARTRAKAKALAGADTSDLKLKHEERITFADVAGIGAAKVELMEVVDFFLKPEKFIRSGSRVPKGVLLVGPPGTGKTLLARAVAGEAGADFFSITASEFVEMFVGVGAARVRSLFEQAKASAPAIVFIDELDAVGRKRGGGGSGNDERDQTLNQLLSELDGFDAAKRGIVVIAATNRPDVLDAALVRPGRFDRKVYVPPPDAEGRHDILRVHLGKKPLAGDVNLHELAEETRGFTGAGLASLVNVAALEAAREQAPALTQAHLLAALEAETLGKLLPGTSALQHLPGPVLRRLALQRAAEALAQELLPQLPGVELVSVAARESSLNGFVRAHVDDTREAAGIYTAAFMRERMVALLAPRAAEEAVYGLEQMSVAHEAAIAEARAICRRCVYVGAFSSSAPALGRRALAYADEDNDFLGSSGMAYMPSHVSDATHAMADAEVTALMEDAYARAARLIAAHRPELDAITEGLMARATLSGEEVRVLAKLPAKTAPLEVSAST